MHTIGVSWSKKGKGMTKSFWRNNGWKFCQFDENYKLIDSRCLVSLRKLDLGTL